MSLAEGFTGKQSKRLSVPLAVLALVSCADDSMPSLEGSAGAMADFSGVYAPAPFVARPAIFEPEAYPFTGAGREQFDAFDVLVDNPRLADDCAPETMPGVLWPGAPMEITLWFIHGSALRPTGAGAAAGQSHSSSRPHATAKRSKCLNT